MGSTPRGKATMCDGFNDLGMDAMTDTAMEAFADDDELSIPPTPESTRLEQSGRAMLTRWLLKTVAADGAAHGDFVWPLEVGAEVAAPDWSGTPSQMWRWAARTARRAATAWGC